MFLGIDFYAPSNPVTTIRFIGLAHSSSADVLVMDAYNSVNDVTCDLLGWTKSDGRTLAGSLKVGGASYLPKPKWNVNAVVNKPMVDLFINLLRLQTTSPVSLLDRWERIEYLPGLIPEPTWISGTTRTNSRGNLEGFTAHNVILDVDANFKTWQSSDRLLLQFQANKV